MKNSFFILSLFFAGIFYEPSLAQTFSSLPDMNEFRRQPASVVLPDGRLLVSGGRNGTTMLNSTELYDPSTGLWSEGPVFPGARYGHQVYYFDNQVLICSGNNIYSGVPSLMNGFVWHLDSAGFSTTPVGFSAENTEHLFRLPSGEILILKSGTEHPEVISWNPITNLSRVSGHFNQGRYQFAACELTDGRILISGGYVSPSAIFSMGNTELYNPVDSSVASGPHMQTDRFAHQLIALPDGRAIAVAGRRAPGDFTTSCEVYDPETNEWAATGSTHHITLPLWAGLTGTGDVFAIGHGSDLNLFAEWWNPNTGDWLVSDTLTFDRTDFSVTVSEEGTIYLTGGLEPGFIHSKAANVYTHPSLPVEMGTLTATPIGTNVLLSWSTHSESNNAGWDILRKVADESEWITVGHVAGAGTTTTPRQYRFEDASVTQPAGTIRYRLVQHDLDGTVTESGTVSVTLQPASFRLFAPYPNPFNPETAIQLVIPTTGFLTLTVFDARGAEVSRLQQGPVSAGSPTYRWDGRSGSGQPAASGFYVIRAVFQPDSGKPITVTQHAFLIR